MYLDDIETRSNLKDKNDDGSSNNDGHIFKIFSKSVKLYKDGYSDVISKKDFYMAQWYVFNNCEEAEPFVEEHKEELLKQGVEDIEEKHREQFPSWFRKKIMQLFNKEKSRSIMKVNPLTMGPDVCGEKSTSCIVNGVRYHIQQHDELCKSQNCGIVVRDLHEKVDIDFYGTITDILELKYVEENSVFLFKCKWFDLLDMLNQLHRDDVEPITIGANVIELEAQIEYKVEVDYDEKDSDQEDDTMRYFFIIALLYLNLEDEVLIEEGGLQTHTLSGVKSVYALPFPDPTYGIALGPRELTGVVDLITYFKLLPHQEFFCKKPFPLLILDTHYLYNVVGDTDIRKGQGMQLDQLIQHTSSVKETNLGIQPFDLDALREAFQLCEKAPIDLPPSKKGIPIIAGKSKSESKDNEKNLSHELCVFYDGKSGSRDSIKMKANAESKQISSKPIEKVIVHPLVLLSIVDHYNRVARDTRKYVVGVFLGTSFKDTVDVTDSYAVPFEEDNRDPILVIIDVQPEELGIPTKVYDVVEKVKENATQQIQNVLVHVPL
ncbi:26S proteasome non-ATPase regulatory subunit 7 -like protein B [Capsicum annuum]|uniref:26S proteasome non-ATPase regulatory subunit 7 -like protein B n=1 Tax=Capsicum annuum TaxID=4072 RepID=A0A2G2YE80_CAPAN|nr:26S proteasome non-ATPase regulatory subunit 7 -like protein B [Capsicum annuum]